MQGEELKGQDWEEEAEEMPEDAVEEAEIITLYADNGEEIDFTEVDDPVLYKGDVYTILKPVEPLDGMEEDEALVFRLKDTEDGEMMLDLVTDDAIIDAVFEEYYRRLSTEEYGDGGYAKEEPGQAD